jgi:Fe-S cluster assembly protein SufB
MSTIEIWPTRNTNTDSSTSSPNASGLSEDTIRLIVEKKQEPDWFLEFRLKAYRHWLKMTEPRHWPNITFPPIDYQDVIYYSAPKQKALKKSLDEVDPELLKTFEKLGPLTEQMQLAGVAVDAMFVRFRWPTYKKKKHGVIFCSFPGQSREHADHGAQVSWFSSADERQLFAAEQCCVFDGSFCFIPKGVKCRWSCRPISALTTLSQDNSAHVNRCRRRIRVVS